MYINFYSPFENTYVKNFITCPYKILNYDFSITNLTIFVIVLLIFYLLIFNYIYNNKLIGIKYDFFLLKFTSFIVNLSWTYLNKKKGTEYSPIIFTIFVFLTLTNLIGLIPFVETITSYFTFTVGLSLIFCITYIYKGIILYKKNFFNMFLPFGVPKNIAFFIIFIDFISFIIRPLILGLRLFVNITAGHILLKFFCLLIFNFWWKLNYLGYIPFELLFISFLTILFIFEIIISIIQAYIFTIMIILFINDCYSKK